MFWTHKRSTYTFENANSHPKCSTALRVRDRSLLQITVFLLLFPGRYRDNENGGGFPGGRRHRFCSSSGSTFFLGCPYVERCQMSWRYESAIDMN